MREEQQLRTFLKILAEYPASMPLTKFLPGFFKKNKQMGSTDRRIASRLIYNYFRLGRALENKETEERLFAAEFLCNTEPNSFLAHFREDYNERASLSLDSKIDYLTEKESFRLNEVFPFVDKISNGIDQQQFLKSFFKQPDLFIRIHPGKEILVKAKLETAGINFTIISERTISFPNGTKLDQVFLDGSKLNKIEGNYLPYEVQDLSSQETGDYFQPKRYESWWDACAASGGKSLLLFSLEKNLKLLVTDIRESVLNNLDERFIGAGFTTYKKKVLDLTQNPDPFMHHYEFDGIIMDAPCSGSGTWGRTPEMINQFEDFKIKSFQNLQRSIAANVVKYLKPGKPLIYITCSVFKSENEEVVGILEKEFGLKLESSKILKGYEHRADTMFVARLIKPEA